MAHLPWRRFHHEVVPSTNDLAFAALEAGEARHGDTFIAAAQTAGRGTRGRTWESAIGGLYLSVVLRSESMPPPGAWTCAGDAMELRHERCHESSDAAPRRQPINHHVLCANREL